MVLEFGTSPNFERLERVLKHSCNSRVSECHDMHVVRVLCESIKIVLLLLSYEDSFV